MLIETPIGREKTIRSEGVKKESKTLLWSLMRMNATRSKHRLLIDGDEVLHFNDCVLRIEFLLESKPRVQILWRVAVFMASKRSLTDEQAHEIEEQLFSTNRLQANRKIPVPLPRPDFWQMIRKLLADLDLEIQELLRKGSRDMRLQNRQRKQSNIRRIASDLARRRMVAMMQYVASQSIRSVDLRDDGEALPPMDWQRHDPAEKAFFLAIQNDIDRFKKEIDWLSIQQGIEGEIFDDEPSTVARGTMQLDAYMSGGQQLTNAPPPTLAFEDHEPETIEFDIDEEDRILVEPEWPELSEYEAQEPIGKTNVASQHKLVQQTSSIAPELVPSVSSKASIPETSPNSNSEPQDLELVRIRILESSDEPIMDEQGNEIELHTGDIHMLHAETAQWLIDTGLAEEANL